MKKIYLSIFAVIIASFSLKAQVSININNLGFDYKCQSLGINEIHELKVTVLNIGSLQPGNTFEILISNDNFATAPVTIIPTNTTISGSQVTLNFTFPNTTYGSNYKFKVRSTAPSVTSGSRPFSSEPGIGLYYLRHNQEIKLNSALGISSAVYCNGNSFELSIFNSGTNSSPLFYPALTYKWYKINSPADILMGSGSTLNVNQAGQYYVVTDYGECTPSSFSKSRNVTITSVSGAGYTITSSSGNTICEGNPVVLSLNITDPTGFSIQWFLNDVAIPAATGVSHTTTVSGTFKAIINNGSCESVTAPFVLNSLNFTSSVSPASPFILAAGQTVPLVVTTNAASPTYQWYFNGMLQSETSNTLIASQVGDYQVKVNQTVGCISTQTFNFILQKPGSDKIPNLISPNGDGINDTWEIPNAILNLPNLKVEILNSRGKKVLSEENYTNNWPQSKDDYINANAVFYYIISQDNSVLHQGSLTVIK